MPLRSTAFPFIAFSDIRNFVSASRYDNRDKLTRSSMHGAESFCDTYLASVVHDTYIKETDEQAGRAKENYIHSVSRGKDNGIKNSGLTIYESVSQFPSVGR